MCFVRCSKSGSMGSGHDPVEGGAGTPDSKGKVAMATPINDR